ncbi:RNase H family protein [Streptomyces sp. NPDC006134]|uniref:RNase H family protein n=1 Tax=Streptomyces sp. NPDC006134 TaxID=3154467 RepID=UPI0033F2A4D3
MRLTLPSGTPEGIPLTVMPVREDAVIGTMSLATLVRLVPSPRQEEDPRALKTASGHDRRRAELRATVQRTLKSQKGRNIPDYAEYIAAGILGKHGSAWSTPPITLWHAGEIAAMSDELLPGPGLRTLTVAPDAMVIAIDGETQTTAWHDIYQDPESFGLTYAELGRRVRIPFELYLGISPADARQIFYDRNVKGVDVAKNLAMSMDQRDLAAALANVRSAETGEGGDGEQPTAAVPADGDRYAVLADLPDTAVVAVADAAVGDESALCGYGWAAEDGTTGYGDSLASSSGEAEVIGVCVAALSLLEQYEDAPVVLLCDSIEAVDAVNTALRSADPATVHRTLLFPESRQLMDRLLRHRHRVQVRWLKGHIGHDLNETADAFARLALRRATGRIPASAARKEEARILRSLGAGGSPLAAAA